MSSRADVVERTMTGLADRSGFPGFPPGTRELITISTTPSKIICGVSNTEQEQSLWLDIGSTHRALGHLRRY
jgi:hypothetical protein